MDPIEAEAEARRLNAQHPERNRFRWIVYPNKDGSWMVVALPQTMERATSAHADPSAADEPD